MRLFAPICRNLLLLVICLGSAAVAAEAKDRALLVGVERYQVRGVPPTPGCVQDALRTEQLLKEKFNFGKDSVRTLLNEQATSANILREFREWLIAGSGPGDRVFFLYSGHGSKLPALDRNEEPDGFDETIAPYDVDPRTGANEIRDNVFHELIPQLSGRRAVLLFDSCHSGTISRGLPPLSQFPQGGGARYLPPPAEFRDLVSEATRGDDPAYAVAPEAGARDLYTDRRVVKASRLGNLSGVVVISAAGAHQLAYPLLVNGEPRGALTFVLAEALGARNPAISELRAYLTDRIGELHRKGQLIGDQEPELEVISTVNLEDEPLFGSWEVAPAVALANPPSPIRVSVTTTGGRSFYRDKEKVAFRVSTSAAGYLYLVVFSRQNVATCIFPSSNDRDNLLQPGSYTFPRGDDGFPVQPPFGRDIVVALVSKKPLNLGDRVEYTWDEVFARLPMKLLRDAVTSASTRGLGAQQKQASSLGNDDWQSASVVLETRAND
jgi:hypothetical protein